MGTNFPPHPLRQGIRAHDGTSIFIPALDPPEVLTLFLPSFTWATCRSFPPVFSPKMALGAALGPLLEAVVFTPICQQDQLRIVRQTKLLPIECNFRRSFPTRPTFFLGCPCCRLGLLFSFSVLPPPGSSCLGNVNGRLRLAVFKDVLPSCQHITFL